MVVVMLFLVTSMSFSSFSKMFKGISPEKGLMLHLPFQDETIQSFLCSK